MTKAEPNPALGIAMKITSALAFTLMSAGIKRLGSDYPTGQVVFFRSAFALVPLAIWLGWGGNLLDSVRTSDLRGHVLRGIIGSCAMFAGFVALSYLPLSDAVAIGYLSPLITVMLAALFLGETVRAYRWSAVGIGFVGVMIMLGPHLDLGSVGSGGLGAPLAGIGFGLVGACCAAGATIQVRRLTATERTGAIVLYFSLLTTLLGAATIVAGWKMPGAFDLVLLVLVGIFGGIGQIFQTQSFRYADASIIAPFDYTTMIFALLIGWVVFGQVPDGAVYIGGAIVAMAGLFVIWRERMLGLDRTKPLAAGGQRAT